MKLSEINSSIIDRARKIKLLVLDVDGVLTSGQLFFTNSGEEIKAFNSLDGHGIKMLQNSGVKVAIITGRTSHIVEKRAASLGINILIQGREDKLAALQEIRQEYSYETEEIAHMGDDHPDLPLIKALGLGMSVDSAHWLVKQHAHWISQFKGGEGAVREACDLIMMAQGTYDDSIKSYL
jgi:3-deoxy-D-manno-octulosonate 8-phosphate phosphatase (KDO 8-P phosphatase)